MSLVRCDRLFATADENERRRRMDLVPYEGGIGTADDNEPFDRRRADLFCRAWANSFGRPTPDMARGMYDVFMRSERPLFEAELRAERAAAEQTARDAEFIAGYALPPPRLPWWRRGLAWIVRKLRRHR